MNYNIAICDDNSTDSAYLSQLVTQWTAESGHTAEIKTFSSAEAFLFHFYENSSYDILLLDIEMTGMDGVSLAKEVRRSNETIQIIFVTGYSDYITEGYEVSALHYLMKPVRPDKFLEVLYRAVQKIKKNDSFLLIETAGETLRIPLYEISYLEVHQNYVTVHAKETHTVKKALAAFASELDNRFYRMGRSYIINLSFVQKVTKTDVYLAGGSVIPLPRGQYESLNRAIITHT